MQLGVTACFQVYNLLHSPVFVPKGINSILDWRHMCEMYHLFAGLSRDEQMSVNFG